MPVRLILYNLFGYEEASSSEISSVRGLRLQNAGLKLLAIER